MRKPRTPLQRILREEGRRQNWLAEQIGRDESTVSLIVNGWRIPDEATRQAIADALRRDVAEFAWPPSPEAMAA